MRQIGTGSIPQDYSFALWHIAYQYVRVSAPRTEAQHEGEITQQAFGKVSEWLVRRTVNATFRGVRSTMDRATHSEI
jgi:hypothetical protein